MTDYQLIAFQPVAQPVAVDNFFNFFYVAEER
jgi:hypothetical protein